MMAHRSCVTSILGQIWSSSPQVLVFPSIFFRFPSLYPAITAVGGGRIWSSDGNVVELRILRR